MFPGNSCVWLLRWIVAGAVVVALHMMHMAQGVAGIGVLGMLPIALIAAICRSSPGARRPG